MRRPVLLLAALCGLGLSVGCLKVPSELSTEPGATSAPPTTPAQVLERYIERAGGESQLRQLPARTIEARMIIHAQPGCEAGDETCLSEDQTGSFLLRTTANGKLYRRTVLADRVEEKGFDGTIGWQRADDIVRLENETELELSKEDAVLHWYFNLKERGIEIALVKPRNEDSDGNVMVLDGVQWELPGTGASPKTMWFDRQTGLLREEIVEDGQGDELQRQTIVYEDYREVDGIQVPHRIRVLNELGEQEQVVEFVTQRVDHQAIEDSRFALPPSVNPKPKPDQRLAALRAAQAAAQQEPSDPSAQVGWARAAWAAGHFDTAMTAAQATLALDRKEPEALILLARGHVLRGELSAALSVLSKASSAGLKPDLLAREQAWVYYRKRDFTKLAKALDTAHNPALAGRFRSFVGQPLRANVANNACVTTVPMTVTDPLAIVQIVVEDEPVAAIIDTGASDLILSSTFAAARGISARPLGKSPPGAPSVGFGQAQELQIGGLTLTNVPVNVFDDRAMAEMAGESLTEVKAVVGLSLLSDFQVTVDVPGKALEIVRTRCSSEIKARRTSVSIPFWQHETHYLYIGAKMNGTEGIYLLNTGMRGADLTATQLAYQHAGIGAPLIRDGVAPMVDVQSFELGDIAFVGQQAAYGFFDQTATADGFRIDGMIGLGLIGRQRWTLDFDTRRIYFAEIPSGS